MSAAPDLFASVEADAHAWAAVLKEEGYCIIPDAIAPARVAALHADLKERFEQTPFCQGDFFGANTKRFGGLLKRSSHAQAFVMNGLILEIAQQILGPYCDCLQLNLTQALEIHPGELVQAPHRDQDMWCAERGHAEYLINVMWPFTPYTHENGATLVYPRSHLRDARTPLDGTGAIAAEMAPGAALIFLGSTLHGAGANISLAPRTGMIVSYCLGWLKPYENQWLVYPPEIARTFSPELAALVGYRQHRPNLGNFEGRCPSILLRGDVPDYLGAIDEVRPDQAAKLAYFKAHQVAQRQRRGGLPDRGG